MSLVELISVVEATEAVDSLQRKPKEYRVLSFFGEYDLWLYVPVYDEKLCPKCEAHAKTQVFRGTELRRPEIFPHLEIKDEDKIMANVHPNCRCELYRIIKFERYERLLAKLVKREKGE